MKNIATAAVALSLIASTATAHEYRRYQEHPQRNEGSTESFVAGAIVGSILGYALTESRSNRPHETYNGYPSRSYYNDYRYRQEPYRYRHCWTERRVDYYGNVDYYRKCR